MKYYNIRYADTFIAFETVSENTWMYPGDGSHVQVKDALAIMDAKPELDLTYTEIDEKEYLRQPRRR